VFLERAASRPRLIFAAATALATAAGGAAFTAVLASGTSVKASQDAYVTAYQPNSPHNKPYLRVDSDHSRRAYIRFTLPVAAGAMQASLRLHVTHTGGAFEVHSTGSNWTESTLTLNNAPAIGALVGTGNAGQPGWTTVALTNVALEGSLDLAVTTSGGFIELDSRETANGPELQLDGAPPPPPSPTPSPTGTAPPSPGGTPTPTATGTASATPQPSDTGTPQPTATATATATATPTATLQPTATPTPSGTATPTPLPAAGPCGTAASPPAQYAHVIWIWMENKSWSSVINNSQAPYETQLAKQCATAPHWDDAGSAFNSEPNYVAATTGLQGAVLNPYTCDCPQGATNSYTGDNLFRQVRAAGMQERSYEEGMPSNCYNSNSGTYAVKHNPAMFAVGGSDRVACQADDLAVADLVTGGAFVNDLNNDTLPAFSFITPNMCNDTHDCGVSTGDQFMSKFMPLILNSNAYRSGNTAVILMWDENTPIPNVVIAPSVVPGTVVSTALSHYSALRATEEMLGLPLLGAAASATSLRGAFHI
jgi:hypothetical protein